MDTKKIDQITGIVLVFFLVFIIETSPVLSLENTAQKATQKVEKAIKIRQQAQKEHAGWEEEKTKLVLEFEQLQQQHKILKEQHRDLLSKETSLVTLKQELLKKQETSLRVRKELVPFIFHIVDRLDTLVATDSPFLKEERTKRLLNINKIMEDPEVSISEKYRKVMEALFIEAEYGNTIEVYQEKVTVGNENVLGNIFRLGRVSLFFLSLDKTTCAVFNPGSDQWQIQSESYLPSISSAMEIGSKHRPVELLSLPLGRLVIPDETTDRKQGGDL